MKSSYDSIFSYNKTFLSLCCLSPIVLSVVIVKFNMVGIIVMAMPCFAIMGVSHFFLKKFYEEYIMINNDKILYKGSKINGQKETIIQTSDLKSILWENESFAFFPGSRNSIYLIDKDSTKHTLVKNKIAAFLSINKHTIEILSTTFKIPIHKEFYVMSSDLKQRRKTQNMHNNAN